jgi:ABC-type multidrug transport system fused ATPase/permease subunit
LLSLNFSGILNYSPIIFGLNVLNVLVYSALVIAMTSWGRVYAFLMADEKMPVSDILSMESDEHITITGGSFTWPDKEGDAESQPEAKGKDDSKTKAATAKLQSQDKSRGIVIDDNKVDLEQGYVRTHIELPIAEPTPEVAEAKSLLSDINISVKMGSLTAIVGSVGSGKSSLLSGIIGEMMCVEGKVSPRCSALFCYINPYFQVACRGSVAYCAQQPWIQTSTLQENILFGQPLNVRRLEEAITTTAFKSDLDQFPHGMSTEIGEKGINLSGGQKARLALGSYITSVNGSCTNSSQSRSTCSLL